MPLEWGWGILRMSKTKNHNDIPRTPRGFQSRIYGPPYFMGPLGVFFYMRCRLAPDLGALNILFSVEI